MAKQCKDSKGLESRKEKIPEAYASGILGGGGCGIRTHVGVNPNGFQDRLVMTASIALHKILSYALQTSEYIALTQHDIF